MALICTRKLNDSGSCSKMTSSCNCPIKELFDCLFIPFITCVQAIFLIKYISMFFFSSFVAHFTVFLSVELWLANFPGKEQNKSAKRSRPTAKLAVDVFPKC